MRGGLAGTGPRGGMGAIDGRLLAGSNITLSPTNGVGNVTITALGGGTGASVTDVGGGVQFSDDLTWDGTDWIAASASTAQYEIDAGAHIWYSMIGVTPGSPVTRYRLGTLDALGVLKLGQTAGDITGGLLPQGFQHASAAGGMIALGTTVANATVGWPLGRVAVYNGATIVGAMIFGADGTTDSSEFTIQQRTAAAGAVRNTVKITSVGRALLGSYTTDITSAAVTTGVQVAGASTAAGVVVTGRQTAATTGAAGQFTAYNGSSFAGTISIEADGATNTTRMDFYAAGTGTANLAFRLSGVAPTSGQSPLFLAYHNGAAVTIQRVTLGAADSGGAGFKTLRVPN